MIRTLLLVAGVGAFGTSGQDQAPSPAAPGSITGTVTIDGEPKITTNKETGAESEEFVIGEGKALANVLVYVKEKPQGVTVPASAADRTLESGAVRYLPHVLSMSVGETLKVSSTNPVNDCVCCKSKVNPGFNVTMTQGQEPVPWKPTAPEIGVRFLSQIDPWKSCYVHVFNHPWHAVTAKDGKYAIKGLPAGEHELGFWHEKMGTQTVKVTVGAKEAKTQDFTFKYEGK